MSTAQIPRMHARVAPVIQSSKTEQIRYAKIMTRFFDSEIMRKLGKKNQRKRLRSDRTAKSTNWQITWNGSPKIEENTPMQIAPHRIIDFFRENSESGRRI